MVRPGSGTISLDDARLFVVVAQELGFGRAARRLGVSTSTLSRRVAALEVALGARLLERSSRRVALTPEGALLLDRAAPLLDGLEAAVGEAVDLRGTPAGPLRVTAPVLTGTEWVAPALFELAARYPEIRLELSLGNAVVDLVADGFDLAVRAGPVSDVEVTGRRLAEVPFALAASPRFVEEHLGGKTRVTRATLGAVPAVVTRQSPAWRIERDGGGIDELRPAPRAVVSDPRVAVDAAEHGLGVVCAPAYLIARRPALVPLQLARGAVASRALWIVHPSRRLLAPRVRVAIDWLIERAPSASSPGVR